MKNCSGGEKNAAPAEAAGQMRSNAGATHWRQILKSRAEKYTIWLVLLVLIGIGALSSEFFLKPSNLLNVLRQVSNLGFLSVGMTFVILSAGIDLSVGSIIGLTSIVVAMLMPQGPWLAIPAAMGSGMAIGFLSGLGVTVGRMPPFIVTLGMLSIGRGLALRWDLWHGSLYSPRNLLGRIFTVDSRS